MKIALFANTPWYLYNFRRTLAQALRAAGHDVLLFSPPGAHGANLRELGFRWVATPMDRRSLNPAQELAFVCWLARLLRRERVDLIHGFTIKCAVYASIAARAAGVRARVSSVAGMGYVFTSQDLRARALRPVVRALMRIALDGASSRLILQNSDDVQLFSSEGLVAPESIRLIRGSGVDCARFAPATRARNGPFRVVLASRLLWDKGIAEFVDAARQLRRQGLPIECIVAGEPDEGNPASVPRAVVRSWAEEGLVQWRGHVDDMPALLRSAHAMVLPSYREGLPKSLIEGAACGLPLVATDVPGCREVVTSERDGLLVPVRDAGGIAAAITRLYADPALCARLGTAARRRAVEEFDEAIVIRRTIEVYEEVAECESASVVDIGSEAWRHRARGRSPASPIERAKSAENE